MAEEAAGSADAGTMSEISSPAAGGSTTEGAVASAEAGKGSNPPASSDWRGGLEGDHLEFAKRLASPADAVKVAYEMRKAQADMIRRPDTLKNATPEDWSKFRKALGAGEKPDDYKFIQGREPTDTEKVVEAKVAEVLHKHHVPISAAGELHNVVVEVAANIEAEQDRVAKEGRAASEAALRKEWGADYDGNVELAKRAAKQFGDPDFLSFLNTTHVNGIKLGDHPAFLKVFGQVGRRMGEQGFIGAVGAEEHAGIQQTIQAKTVEMHKAMADGDRMTANRLNKELFDLHSKTEGSVPIVGRSGRVA